MQNMDSKWHMLKQVYSEEMIHDKTLPKFFDFFNYSQDFDNVYEPAEDTFLLIDCLELDKENIEEFIMKFGPINSAEIGCGSGLVTSCYLDKIHKKAVRHFCVDINEDCLKLTKNLLNNYYLGDNVSFIKSDLMEYFAKEEIKLDLIIFNPPYVTTDKFELDIAQEKKDISASWAGGETGSEVIFKFIQSLQVSFR